MAKRRIIPLFIPHLGCPNQCVFCNQRTISGEEKPVTPEQISTMIAAALPYAGKGCELAFYGGSFTAIPKDMQRGYLEAARPFVQSGEVGSIRLSTRPDAVGDSECELLKEYGVETVELGCQSMDAEVLRLSKRGHTAEDTENAISMLRRYGFSVILQMMTGLPGDSGPQSIRTAERIIQLRPDGVRIYPTVVLRSTELEHSMKEGDYQPQSVSEAVALCATLYQQFLDAGIPVIRLGLNPTKDLSGGEAMAGAYHPALGELVLSEMYLRRARNMLISGTGENVELYVHPKRVSVMTGQRCCNLKSLRQEFCLRTLQVLPKEQDVWSLQVHRW